MEIAIFGAGIAGLMSAVVLRADGHHCRVIEPRREALAAGMGFILAPSGMACLRDEGLSLIEGAGMALRTYCHRLAQGRLEHCEPLPEGSRGVLRSELVDGLRRLLPENTFHFGAGLDHLRFDSDRRVTGAVLQGGATVHADLYLGTEGVHSRARQSLFPSWTRRHAQVWELVGVTHCRETLQWASRNLNKFHHPLGGLAFGILPVGPDTAVWYLQYDTERIESPPASPQNLRAFVQRHVGGWGQPVPMLLDGIDMDRIHLWRPLDIDLVPHFHGPNLALLGDAAHPLSPFSSQGVSSALADAIALRQALRSGQDLPDALATYSRQRREDCLPCVARGRDLSTRFLAPQLRSAPTVPMA